MVKALEVFLIMVAVGSPFLIAIFMVNYFKYRSEVARRQSGDRERFERENDELKRHVANLRERVEVLEAIVTDKRYDLGVKIANL
jgi:cell division protein FtsB